MMERNTKETKIKLKLEIYGTGKSKINTKIGFLNHMLEAFAKHSLMDLEVECDGDIEVDFHHSVEDIGIVLGMALKEQIYPVKNIERYSNSVVVMDESAVSCDLDISNRAFLVYDSIKKGLIGEFDAELMEEFFRAVAFNAGITLHLIKLRGSNKHHIAEATFKAFAVALRRALTKNEKMGIPSTKGVL
ncbi:imidazoleglycerol-phosphate dehydratase HisB [Campylobacter ureolyticus]|mgnify:FL=1|uniref:Imidazoleglycerol-phosphate dehydratase n=1 Tax=Campylobacter ureolyticus TaxID=827 RepID=A0A9Q4KLQ0_9BACT|nr:imidazoleglycerol-phosphate dehydratase HisB [Campylobacter ureolyticus]MCZ6159770.1 imidazoleglycerol-phosphate dehydratase HisB [Campylobacter ureolyticus]MCZ6163101.1 imidazoleglycerol-phosphate dehydratase HisB [Campylobacter ureolyticus]MCZ6164952.1 imidazoleglycerol-phosphate dehydratase HisB [Campylobacter ureolyticus]MCZ6174481.1 imidazoleglycerol-phosphate dehydratase HisB [Campylobacter ureolyticus]MCZ6186252.1 imidazoleglycerol-phosphate dehydratase HisB [Campylobacter ureolyticu